MLLVQLGGTNLDSIDPRPDPQTATKLSISVEVVPHGFFRFTERETFWDSRPEPFLNHRPSYSMLQLHRRTSGRAQRAAGPARRRGSSVSFAS